MKTEKVICKQIVLAPKYIKTSIFLVICFLKRNQSCLSTGNCFTLFYIIHRPIKLWNLHILYVKQLEVKRQVHCGHFFKCWTSRDIEFNKRRAGSMSILANGKAISSIYFLKKVYLFYFRNTMFTNSLVLVKAFNL